MSDQLKAREREFRADTALCQGAVGDLVARVTAGLEAPRQRYRVLVHSYALLKVHMLAAKSDALAQAREDYPREAALQDANATIQLNLRGRLRRGAPPTSGSTSTTTEEA